MDQLEEKILQTNDQLKNASKRLQHRVDRTPNHLFRLTRNTNAHRDIVFHGILVSTLNTTTLFNTNE